MENYAAVLSIIEVNLSEYSELLETLSAIQAEVQSLNTALLLERQESFPEDDEPYEEPNFANLQRRRSSFKEVKVVAAISAPLVKSKMSIKRKKSAISNPFGASLVDKSSFKTSSISGSSKLNSKVDLSSKQHDGKKPLSQASFQSHSSKKSM